MFRQPGRSEGDLGVEQIPEGTFLLPDHIIEESQGLPPHVLRELPFPPGEELAGWGHIVEAVEVQPLSNEAGGLFPGTGIVQHTPNLGAEKFLVRKFPLTCGFQQFLVGRASPEDVAQTGGELVLSSGPQLSIAALVLHPVNETRRLEHGLDDQFHALLVVSPCAGDGG